MAHYLHSDRESVRAKISLFVATRGSIPTSPKNPQNVSISGIARGTGLDFAAVRRARTHIEKLAQQYPLENGVIASRADAIAKIRAAYETRPLPPTGVLGLELQISSAVIMSPDVMAVIKGLVATNGRLTVPLNIEEAVNIIREYGDRLRSEGRTIPWLHSRDKENLAAIARETGIPVSQLKLPALADAMAALISDIGHEERATVEEECALLKAYIDTAIAARQPVPLFQGAVSNLEISRLVGIAVGRLEQVAAMKAEIRRWASATAVDTDIA